MKRGDVFAAVAAQRRSMADLVDTLSDEQLALDFLTGPWPFGFVPFRLLRGLSLYARDVDSRWGGDLEIAGPAVGVMMTITGRSACLRELDGPGVAVLRNRLLST